MTLGIFQFKPIKMKTMTKSILGIALMLAAFAASAQEVRTLLKGEVFNVTFQKLALMKATEDFDHGERTLITVKEGKFEHELTADVLEVYVLFFEEQLAQGGIHTFYFVPDSDSIHFKLYLFDEYEKTEISGSKATDEITFFHKEMQETFQPDYDPLLEILDQMIESGEFFSDQYMEYQLAYRKAIEEEDYEKAVYYTTKRVELRESGDHVSEKGRVIENQMHSIDVRITQWGLNYLDESLSLYSYLRLIQLTQSLNYIKGLTYEDLNTLAEKFYAKYPDHPYTSLSKSMMEALKRIQVGNKFVDFALPDLEGNFHQLSEVIEGKYAVIDLWASWCGPCIMGSRELLPIYEEFKDKGFTICGVAREFKSTDRMAHRIEAEGFSWVNLVELDDRNKIWLQYGVSGGGKKFLVDDKGIILAIDPKPDEVRDILVQRLSGLPE
jgi:thiol-disulfide isomerase/thioredoxin